jgi:hypothetical protein
LFYTFTHKPTGKSVVIEAVTVQHARFSMEYNHGWTIGSYIVNITERNPKTTELIDQKIVKQ